MAKWVELAPSTFSPAPGPVPAPDYWCTPWTVWTPAPDPPKFYLERDQTYTIHVPDGKQATHMDLRFIGYRKKNWKDNIINVYVNEYDSRGTSSVLTSDSGTCAAGYYKLRFSARSNVTLRIEDGNGDARFVATHISLQVEDGPTTTTPSQVSTTPITRTVTVTRESDDPKPSSSVSNSQSTPKPTPTPTPETNLFGNDSTVIIYTTTRADGTLSVPNSIGASDSFSTDASSTGTSTTDSSAPTAPPGDDVPSSRSRSGLLGLLALGCLAIVASF